MNSHHVSNNNNFNVFNSNSSNTTNSKDSTADFKIQKFFQSSADTTAIKSQKKAYQENNSANKLANAFKNFFTKPAQKKQQEQQQENEEQHMNVSIEKNPIESSDDDSSSCCSSEEFEVKKQQRRKKRKISLRREAVITVHKSKNRRLSSKSNIKCAESPSIEEISSNNDSIGSSLAFTREAEKGSSVNIHKESLILFDEIDIVFKEDVGFFAAINHFIKKSRKPIILTTNDDFLQEKINLNIEKIQFMQPRIDSGVKFLKTVASAENLKLETSAAYKILNDCKCDMRRALVQLQCLLKHKSNNHVNKSLLNLYQNTLFFSKTLQKFLFSKCKYHTETHFYDSLFNLDFLTKRLSNLLLLECSFLNSSSIESLTFDTFLIRDGLTDNSTQQIPFNPFLNSLQVQQMQQFQNNQDPVDTLNDYDLTKFNTTYLKEELLDFFVHFVCLFNESKSVDFWDWLRHGRVNKFSYGSSSCMNKLAQSMFKFTSNESLSLDYRPYLHEICQLEELKQFPNGSASSSMSRRRFLHYLMNARASLALSKEDLDLLARSSLDERKILANLNAKPSNEQLTSSTTTNNAFSNSDLYSDLYSDDK